MRYGHPAIARRQLVLVLERPDAEIDLAGGALAIAGEEYPTLDSSIYESWLDRQASRIRRRAPDNSGGMLEAAREVLFQDESLRGNATDYYDPKNSFLNEVIDRKTGIPLTLSIVFLEVCWRVGLTALGIGLPGHVIVAVEAQGAVLIDPFNAGDRVTVDGCADLVRRSAGSSVAFTPSMLRPLSRSQMLSRMLNNLKSIYLRTGDDSRLLAVLDRLLLLDPRSTSDLWQRALICQRIGFYGQALSDYRRFLDLVPSGPDAASVHATLAGLASGLAWRN